MSKKVGRIAEKSVLGRLFEIAESQAGYFSARQATAASVSRQALSHHAREGGSVIRVRRGLYRLRDFPSSQREHLVAEWLDTGQPIDAVLSHETAAELHDLTDLIPSTVHMTASRRNTGRRVPHGVKLHFVTDGVPADERTERNGIPLTTVERTIVDLVVSHGTTEQTELAVAQALDRGLTTPELLRQTARSRSATALRRVDQALERHRG
jgi:predicted transcriptional regulator of viral defense system